MRLSPFSLFFILSLCGVPTLGWAMEGNVRPPIEISADQSLEWHKNDRLYLALGNAKAVRGETIVTADTLSAHEREALTSNNNPAATDQKKMQGDIDRLTAQGNVHIRNTQQQVFGDLAVYDLDKKIARVTGKNLKYIAGTDIVTAHDALEYDEIGRTATARGKAVALREGRHIEGDIITAHFGQKSSGAMDLTVVTAQGNVTVITGSTTATGSHALYDAKKNIATISGNVKISSADSQLMGDKAEIDFSTGQSRLINTGKTGRVKALLLPTSSDPASTSRSIKDSQ